MSGPVSQVPQGQTLTPDVFFTNLRRAAEVDDVPLGADADLGALVARRQGSPASSDGPDGSWTSRRMRSAHELSDESAVQQYSGDGAGETLARRAEVGSSAPLTRVTTGGCNTPD